MNHSIESKSNEITVLFMSGIHVSGRGFLASYSVIEKQGNYHFIPMLPHFMVSKNKKKWNVSLSTYYLSLEQSRKTEQLITYINLTNKIRSVLEIQKLKMY